MAHCWRAAVALAFVGIGAGSAQADKIKNPTAVLSGLDKITGRIISFEASVDETVQFGALQMTPRACYSRPPTESPHTTAFLEIDEVTLDNKQRRIFSGWMFAASPGLHGVEHPVYDVWLVDCKDGTEIIAEPKEKPQEPLPLTSAQGRPTAQPAGDIMAPPTPGGRLDLAPPRSVAPPQQLAPPAARRFFPSDPGGQGFR